MGSTGQVVTGCGHGPGGRPFGAVKGTPAWSLVMLVKPGFFQDETMPLLDVLVSETECSSFRFRSMTNEPEDRTVGALVFDEPFPTEIDGGSTMRVLENFRISQGAAATPD
uniref:Uncharacterized protein n=1 Tax=Oryza meridionalis TaxID=40149 RepID=A0A0E0CYB9_9ORYZ